jgi:hypothetical protein
MLQCTRLSWTWHSSQLFSRRHLFNVVSVYSHSNGVENKAPFPYMPGMRLGASIGTLVLQKSHLFWPGVDVHFETGAKGATGSDLRYSEMTRTGGSRESDLERPRRASICGEGYKRTTEIS